MDTTSAKQQGERIKQSRTFEVLVTVGLISFGVVHVGIAIIALQIAFTGGGPEASQQGAFGELAKHPAGVVMLLILSLGFLALTAWQILLAVIGYREFSGGKRTFKRLSSAGRAVVYLLLAISAITTVVKGRQSGDAKTQSLTARLMSVPFGQILVVVVGLAVVGVGGSLIYRGAKKKFTEDLDGNVGSAVLRLGQVGYIAKGIAYAIVGVLFVIAGISYDPKKASGLDGALRTLRNEPFGVVLLVLVGLGIASFGVYCFAWSRHAKR